MQSSSSPTTLSRPAPDQFVGAFIGCAIGDSLGWPYEGQPRSAIPDEDTLWSDFQEIHRKNGNAPYPPGSWSDDTQQSLIVATSILAYGKVNQDHIASSLLNTWRAGEAVGFGAAFREAMERLANGRPPCDAGDPDRPWNGAAMRVLPIALLHATSPDQLVNDVTSSSVITHRHPDAITAAILAADAIRFALQNAAFSPNGMLDFLVRSVSGRHPDLVEQIRILGQLIDVTEEEAWTKLLALPNAPWAAKTTEGISVNAIPTVLTSIAAFLRHPGSFTDAVGCAIRMGGDTDSTGAIAGSLSGAHLGVSAVPSHLMAQLKDVDQLIAAAEGLYAMANA